MTPRRQGPGYLRPLWKAAAGVAVPNTVTKTLRTDKVYEADLSDYAIEAYPEYSPLPDQVRTIRPLTGPSFWWMICSTTASGCGACHRC